jgi:hypothetical protein
MRILTARHPSRKRKRDLLAYLDNHPGTNVIKLFIAAIYIS